jgi:hypothetical protein
VCWEDGDRLGGSNHGQLYGLIEWKGKKVLHMHYFKGLGKCWVGAPHSYEGLGVDKGS